MEKDEITNKEPDKKGRGTILKTVLGIVLAVVFFASVPLALLGSVFLTPSVYDETYYGQLIHMVRRLNNTEGRKIVFVGNSAMAFGLRPDLIEKEIPGYDAVVFGLYGAIGTKAMIDLSGAGIGDGDIVVLAPEQYAPSLSLAFSGSEMWLAADADYSLLGYLPQDDGDKMIGAFVDYAQRKFSYTSKGKKPETDGVYMQSSFDDEAGNEVGYMTYERPYNTMPFGYDANALISYDPGLFGDGFIDYVNEYAAYVRSVGAEIYYGFAPVNRFGLTDDTTAESIEAFYSYVVEHLDMEIMGHPADYIMDYEWFYDSNLHMNSSGMYAYTRRVVEDIKAQLMLSSDTDIEVPEKPIIPSDGDIEEGDNKDAHCFTYEIRKDEAQGTDIAVITGLTEDGSAKSELTVPASYDGKPVALFEPTVFRDHKKLSSVVISGNIRMIFDGSFSGCTRLREIRLTHKTPCGVGLELFSGTDGFRIYVPASALDVFATHYNWSAYKDYLTGYET